MVIEVNAGTGAFTKKKKIKGEKGEAGAGHQMAETFVVEFCCENKQKQSKIKCTIKRVFVPFVHPTDTSSYLFEVTKGDVADIFPDLYPGWRASSAFGERRRRAPQVGGQNKDKNKSYLKISECRSS